MLHDENYKRLFASPLMVQDVLRACLPAHQLAAADLSSLGKLSPEYVSDELRKRHGDTVWHLRLGRHRVFLLVLLEFQAQNDHWMALRILTCTGLLYQDLVRNRAPAVAGEWAPGGAADSALQRHRTVDRGSGDARAHHAGGAGVGVAALVAEARRGGVSGGRSWWRRYGRWRRRACRCWNGSPSGPSSGSRKPCTGGCGTPTGPCRSLTILTYAPNRRIARPLTVAVRRVRFRYGTDRHRPFPCHPGRGGPHVPPRNRTNHGEAAKERLLELLERASREVIIHDDGDRVADSIYENPEVVRAAEAACARGIAVRSLLKRNSISSFRLRLFWHLG